MMSVTTEVVEEVAEERDMDETELPPLAHAINTDALEKLFDPNAASGVVTFEYAGVTVQVDDEGVVDVHPDLVR